MECLKIARSRFSEVLPDDLEEESSHLVNYRVDPNRIQKWIEEYVLPAVAQVEAFPLFREYATWPQRHLAPGVDTEERRLVEAVQNESRDCARTFESVIRESRLLARQFGLDEEEPADAEEETSPQWQTIEIRSDKKQKQYHFVSPAPVPSINTVHGLVSIMNGFLPDLVEVTDYFSSVSQIIVPAEPKKNTLDSLTQNGDLPIIETPFGFYQTALNPSLGASRMFLVGDHITRATLARAGADKTILENARRTIHHAIRQAGRPLPAAKSKIEDAWQRYVDAFDRLEQQLRFNSEMNRRDACMTLVQVYVAYRDPADLNWLDLPKAAFTYKNDWRQKVLGSRMHVVETLQRIAAALGEVNKMVHDQPEIESEISSAIATGGLVILESRQEAYWEGNPITHNWRTHRLEWKLLSSLAQRARRSAFVEMGDVYEDDEPRSDSALSSLWNRLKSHLPGTLHRHVGPGPERATYKLELPRERVFLFG